MQKEIVGSNNQSAVRARHDDSSPRFKAPLRLVSMRQSTPSGRSMREDHLAMPPSVDLEFDCSPQLVAMSMSDYVGLDYCEWINELHHLGYKPPWKMAKKCGYVLGRLISESVLDSIVTILDLNTDDNRAVGLIEEIESEVGRIKENAKKFKKYEVPLGKLLVLLPKAKQRASQVWEARTAAVREKAKCSAEGLPCGIDRKECALDSIAVVSRLSQDMTCFNPIMTFKVTPRYSQTKLDMESFSKESLVALAKQHQQVEFVIQDHVAHEDPITFVFDFSQEWTATVAAVQRTQCSLPGGAMMDWLISALRDFGFHRIYLEDDARVQCMYPDGEMGEETPLRILYMLKGEQPSKAGGFYEAKGFRHVAGEEYDASKELLNMNVRLFQELLQCTQETRGITKRTRDKALKALERDHGAEDETIFQWMKRNNELSQKGDHSACKRTSSLANCFWRRSLIWSSPFRKTRCMHLDEERLKAWEKLSTFGADYRKMVFVRHLQN